jgi:uncharacterized membrane protein (UPF0127 family)
MFRLAPLALFAIFSIPPAWSGELFLRVGPHPVRAEIADTPQAREYGLMQRRKLCGDCGMLFIFPLAKPYSFWMKNTPLPLSIAFIAADGHILNIEDMRPETTDLHTAAGNALYVLEMNQGWFDRHHIKSGDHIDNLGAAPAARQ